MQNQKLRFGLFLIILTAVEAVLTLWPARYFVTGHEGDMLHMLDMGLRMADGEIPHLDFMTPIGVLGIAPVALFLAAGFGAAKSAVMADLLVLLVLLPALWWVGVTRLHGVVRYLFGTYIIVLLSALVHGGDEVSTSLSLYYNRWAWGISLIMLVTVLFPAKSPLAEAWAPALITGLALALLALIKMTYFITFAPAIVLILLAQKQFRLLGLALGVGLLVAGLTATILGVEFVLAYRDDLMALALGDVIRDRPGASLIGILASPKTIINSMVLLGAILVFRKGNRPEQGLALLILVPAFTYITYQNWGNDPKWLVFVIIYLAAFLPDSGGKRQSALALVVVGLTVVTPSFINMLSSPVRVGFSNPEQFQRVPIAPHLADFMVPKERVIGTDALVNIPGIPAYSSKDDSPVEINGVTMLDCSTAGGLINTAVLMSAQLDSLPEVTGRQILLADILSILWLVGDQVRVEGAAPWYYDDDSGFDAAEYFVVPNCPIAQDSRNNMVRKMLATGWQLEQRFQSPLMVVYRIIKTD